MRVGRSQNTPRLAQETLCSADEFSCLLLFASFARFHSILAAICMRALVGERECFFAMRCAGDSRGRALARGAAPIASDKESASTALAAAASTRAANSGALGGSARDSAAEAEAAAAAAALAAEPAATAQRHHAELLATHASQLSSLLVSLAAMTNERNAAMTASASMTSQRDAAVMVRCRFFADDAHAPVGGSTHGFAHRHPSR